MRIFKKVLFYKEHYWQFLVVALSFYFLGQFSHKIQAIANVASPIWPASGVAIGFLLIYSRKLFPAVFLGCVLLEMDTGLPLWSILTIAFGNSLECFVGATILRKVVKRKGIFFVKGEMSGIVISSFVGALISALIGVAALYFSGAISGHQIELTFMTWFLGDFVGILVCVPIFVETQRLPSFFKELKKDLLANKTNTAILAIFTFLYWYFVYYVRIGNGAGFLILPICYFLVAKFSSLIQRLYLLVCLTVIIILTALADPNKVLGSVGEAMITVNIIATAIILTVLGLNRLKLENQLQKLLSVVFSGWVIVSLLFVLLIKSKFAVEKETWDNLTRESINSINVRFNSYVDALVGGVGLVKAHPDLTNKEWRTYVKNINLLNRYPGINGIGIIYPISVDDKDRFAQKHQKKLVFNFPIHPVSNIKEEDKVLGRKELFIISHIEPYKVNQPALGLDVGSEKKRRAAAEKSRDTGEPVVTELIQLVQDTEKTPGFLLFVPFYKESLVEDSVEWRRINLLGWVYAPFIMNRFLNGVLGANSNVLDLIVFDGTQADINRVAFSSLPIKNQADLDKINRFQKTKTSNLKLGGRDYTVIITPNKNYAPPTDYMVGIVGLIGLLLVLAIAFMFSSTLSVRQRAEKLANEKTKELSTKEAIWRTIMESAPVGIFQTDLIGNCVYANTKWCQITGLDFQDLILKKWESIIYVDDLVKVNQLLDMSQHQKQSIEFRLRNSKGEMIWIEGVSSLIVNDQGKGTGFVMILMDVTEKISQIQIIEAERLKLIQTSKMASLGVMAGGVAHEINNPLAIIMGKAERLLKSDAQDLTPEFVMQNVTKIEQMTARIAKIIKGLRSFSRNSEKDPYTEVPLQAVVDDTLEFCRERFKNHQVKLVVEGPLDLKISARPAELSQVLLNLMNNAFDAIHELPEKWVKVIVEEKAEWVRIQIIDSGHGIPKNVADRLMEPFFTTKPVGKGTGLGLSISKGIIEDHHGRFWINHEHVNTCFVIEIPKPKPSTVIKIA